MTTTEKSSREEQAVEQTILNARMIPIGEIAPSPYNTRRIFDSVKLDELAQSIRSAGGIIEPLIVRSLVADIRKSNSTKYQLIAGERRLRAAALAQLAEVPCILKDGLDDNAVLDLQLIENAQREDLHPIEEAQGFEQRKKAGATIDEVARIVGKDRTFVSRRLQLLNLIPEAQEVFLRGGLLPKHGLMIARLPQSEQGKALLYTLTDDWDKAAKGLLGIEKFSDTARSEVTPASLAEFIDSAIMRPLSAAPWSKKDAALLPEAGACNTCEKRTGHNPLLFDEAGAKNDRCLDGACYEAKFEAHLVQLQTKATAKGEPLRPIASGEWSVWREVHGDRCKFEVKGLVTEGRNRGQIKRVCLDKKCPTHWSSARNNARSNEQRDREEKYRTEREYRAKLWTAVSREVKQPDIEDCRTIALYMWDRAQHDLRKAYMEVKGIEAPKLPNGYGGHHLDCEKPVAKLIAAMKTTKDLLIWMATFSLFRDAHIAPYEIVNTKDELHKAAERYKVDAKGIRKEVDAEFQQRRDKKKEAEKKKLDAAKAKSKAKGAQGKLL